MELSSSTTTNIPIDKPAKAPIQLSEGWWFGPTHGFYTFTHPKSISLNKINQKL